MNSNLIRTYISIPKKKHNRVSATPVQHNGKVRLLVQSLGFALISFRAKLLLVPRALLLSDSLRRTLVSGGCKCYLMHSKSFPPFLRSVGVCFVETDRFLRLLFFPADFSWNENRLPLYLRRTAVLYAAERAGEREREKKILKRNAMKTRICCCLASINRGIGRKKKGNVSRIVPSIVQV